MNPAVRDIKAVIFDKDGTLVDFHSTWDDSLGRTLDHLLGDRPQALAAVAEGLGFDLTTRTILDDSPFVAGSGAELVGVIAPHVDPITFESVLIAEGVDAARPIPEAFEILTELKRRGIKLGVATNDAEESAISQFAALGWGRLFDAVLGYDSGYTSKPSAKMVLGCCDRLGVGIREVIMVGDTATDMRAAKSAGVYAVMIGNDPSAMRLADHRIDMMSDLLELFP